MSKGARRERQAREIYEQAGYWVYSPQNVTYGDNDLWNLFDLACFHAPAGEFRFVQVKSNGARGIRKWSTVAKHFQDSSECVQADFVIPYDNEGWRLVRPSDGSHTTVYDERESDCPMGEGLTRFITQEVRNAV